jgi:hypothetical protein
MGRSAAARKISRAGLICLVHASFDAGATMTSESVCQISMLWRGCALGINKLGPKLFTSVGRLLEIVRNGIRVTCLAISKEFGIVGDDFVIATQTQRPCLTAWAQRCNHASFDLPVLRYRAMVHKVAAAGLTARPYFNRYTDDAVDLCDAIKGHQLRIQFGDPINECLNQFCF